MNLHTWYWLILVIWIIFGAADIFVDDPRWRRGGNLVLIILLILLGLMTAGKPIQG